MSDTLGNGRAVRVFTLVDDCSRESPGLLVHHAIGALRITEFLDTLPHPEQGYRACLGLLSLARRYTPARLEGAATRALATHAVSYRSIKSMLTTGVDQLPLDDAIASTDPVLLPTTHQHVRGAACYRHSPIAVIVEITFVASPETAALPGPTECCTMGGSR